MVHNWEYLGKQLDADGSKGDEAKSESSKNR
jgi:hypothetical protein